MDQSIDRCIGSWLVKKRPHARHPAQRSCRRRASISSDARAMQAWLPLPLRPARRLAIDRMLGGNWPVECGIELLNRLPACIFSVRCL